MCREVISVSYTHLTLPIEKGGVMTEEDFGMTEEDFGMTNKESLHTTY